MMKPCASGKRSVGAGMLLAVGLAAGSCGGPGATGGPPAVGSSVNLPPGYAFRLDRPNRDDTEFVVTAHDDGLEVQTGPAGIVYRPGQLVDADTYAVRARFTEVNAPVGHLEGFGLFIGGEDLQGSGQRYTYFLIRGDGRYIVKQRDGANAPEISKGWQPSKAVRVASHQDGDMTNELAIAVDGGRLRFSCNGEQVADLPVGDLSARGVVGVRVNHNLVVRVQDFRVER